MNAKKTWRLPAILGLWLTILAYLPNAAKSAENPREQQEQKAAEPSAVTDAELFATARETLGENPQNYFFAYANWREIAAAGGEIYALALDALNEKISRYPKRYLRIVESLLAEFDLSALQSSGSVSSVVENSDNLFNVNRQIYRLARERGVFSTLARAKVSLTLADELARLPENTLAAGKFNLNFDDAWRQLLDNPVINRYLTRGLRKIPFPVAQMVTAIGGVWEYRAAVAEQKLVLVITMPDRDSALFNYVSAIAAMSGKVQISAEQITVPLPEKLAEFCGAELVIAKRENQLTVSTFADRAEKFFAAAQISPQNLAAQLTPQLAKLPPVAAGYFYFNPRPLAPFANRAEFLSLRTQLPPETLSAWRNETAENYSVNIIDTVTTFDRAIPTVAAAPKTARLDAILEKDRGAFVQYLAASPAFFYAAFLQPALADAVAQIAATNAQLDEKITRHKRGADAETFKTLNTAFGLFSGVTEITRAGISGRAIGEYAGTTAPNYRYRAALLGEKFDGAIWQFFGKKNIPLAELAADIPANAVAALQTETDLLKIFAQLRAAGIVGKDGVIGKDWLQDGNLNPESKLLFSALAEGKVQLVFLPPFAAENSAARDFPFEFYLRAADRGNLIYQKYAALIAKSGDWRAVENGLEKIGGDKFPLTRIAKGDGEIIFASSTDSLRVAALAKYSAEPRLTADPQFKKLAQNLPAEINSFMYISPAFLADLPQIIAREAADSAADAAKKIAASPLFAKVASPFLLVGERADDGQIFTMHCAEALNNWALRAAAAILLTAITTK